MEFFQHVSIKRTVRCHAKNIVLFDLSTIYYLKSVSIRRTVIANFHVSLLNVPYNLKMKRIITWSYRTYNRVFRTKNKTERTFSPKPPDKNFWIQTKFEQVWTSLDQIYRALCLLKFLYFLHCKFFKFHCCLAFA